MILQYLYNNSSFCLFEAYGVPDVILNIVSKTLHVMYVRICVCKVPSMVLTRDTWES